MLKIIKFAEIILFVVALVPTEFAHAAALSPVEESRTRQAEKLMNVQTPDTANWVAKFKQAWMNKCFPLSDRRNCHVDECEVSAQDCRPNRALYFRGEPQRFPTPATSGLLRALWAGSAYHADAESGLALLEGLRKDLAPVRPIETYTFTSEDDAWILDGKTKTWSYSGGGQIKPPNGVLPANVSSFRNILFSSHASGDYLAYQDEKLEKKISLDALISFSPSPFVSGTFVGDPAANTGRLIVLSVPELEIVNGCGEEVPVPGTLQNSAECEQSHADEFEFDSILYVSPDYVWKTF